MKPPTLSEAEHQQREKQEEYQKLLQERGGHPMGIVCDYCKTELVNPHPNVTICTNPPMYHWLCPGCKASGTTTHRGSP